MIKTLFSVLFGSKAMIIMVALFVTSLGGAVWSWYHHIKTSAKMEAENAATVEAYIHVNDKYQDAIRQLNSLNNEFDRSRRSINEMERRLADNDLEQIAKIKPGVFLDIVNTNTRQLFDAIEAEANSASRVPEASAAGS